MKGAVFLGGGGLQGRSSQGYLNDWGDLIAV